MRRDLDETFLALGDPVRLGIVALLRDAPRCSSDIATAMATSRPTTSRHLSVLRRAGIIEEAAQGEDARVRVYRLRRERFAQIRDFVEDVEAFWGDKLEGFKAYAEAKHARRGR